MRTQPRERSSARRAAFGGSDFTSRPSRRDFPRFPRLSPVRRPRLLQRGVRGGSPASGSLPGVPVCASAPRRWMTPDDEVLAAGSGVGDRGRGGERPRAARRSSWGVAPLAPELSRVPNQAATQRHGGHLVRRLGLAQPRPIRRCFGRGQESRGPRAERSGTRRLVAAARPFNPAAAGRRRWSAIVERLINRGPAEAGRAARIIEGP
jgi:hypothetical protein